MGFQQAAYNAGVKAGSSKKKFIIITVAAVILLSVVLIMIFSHSSKEFSYNELRIKLSSSYKEPDTKLSLKMLTSSLMKARPDYTLVNSDKTVYIYRDDKATNQYNSLSDYAAATKSAYAGAENAQIQQRGSYYYFIADGEMIGSDEKAKSVVAVFESAKAFWTVDIGGYAKQFSEKSYLENLDTVAFKG